LPSLDGGGGLGMPAVEDSIILLITDYMNFIINLRKVSILSTSHKYVFSTKKNRSQFQLKKGEKHFILIAIQG